MPHLGAALPKGRRWICFVCEVDPIVQVNVAGPPGVNWKSHNYTHLLEQPTLFYAVIVFLHLSGGDTALTQGFAWAYVVLRIVHSLWQATVNRVPVRFALFSLSTLCLLALSVLAVIATLG